MSGEIRSIAERLAASAQALAAELLPAGRRQGREWLTAAKDSPFGCSVSVHLFPPRAGVWSAWAAGQAGDALDLVAAIRFGSDKVRALRWALQWLGSPERPAPTPVRLAPAPDPRDGQAWRARAAKAIWLAGAIELQNTAVDRYLKGRGIELERLSRQPRALRAHPGLWNTQSRQRWPAMVAAVQDRNGQIVAVHRTWLASGGIGKAPIEEPKMTLGPKRGGYIALWRGASSKPLRAAEHGETVIISEGIEDGLSCAIACPDLRVLAAIDLGNMAALELPPQIATVIIATQNDPWWTEGQERWHGAAVGLDRAVQHFQAQGRQVRLARPAAGKDLNDLLRGQAA
jgi:hypothetical protein